MPSALVLSPHTDDGELGCGGTIAKLVARGWRVHMLYFTACGRDVLVEEARRSDELLGVTHEILDFQVRHFPRDRQRVLEALYARAQEHRYALVFTPATTDVHQDHGVVTAEAVRAFRDCTLLGYELPWNNLTVTLNGFVALDEAHVAQKLAALDCYHSQKHNSYFNPDYFRAVMRTRGVQLASDYAEGFEVIKVALDRLL